MKVIALLAAISVVFALSFNNSFAQNDRWKTWKIGDVWTYGPIEQENISIAGPKDMNSNGCFLPETNCLSRLFQEDWGKASTGWFRNENDDAVEGISYYETVANRCNHYIGVVHCMEKKPQESLIIEGKNIWKPWMKKNNVCRFGYLKPDGIKQGHLAGRFKPTGRTSVRYIGIEKEKIGSEKNEKICMDTLTENGAIFEQSKLPFHGEFPTRPFVIQVKGSLKTKQIR